MLRTGAQAPMAGGHEHDHDPERTPSRRRGARDAARPVLWRGALPEGGRAAARAPAAGARPRLRGVGPRPRRRHRAAVERLGRPGAAGAAARPDSRTGGPPLPRPRRRASRAVAGRGQAPRPPRRDAGRRRAVLRALRLYGRGDRRPVAARALRRQPLPGARARTRRARRRARSGQRDRPAGAEAGALRTGCTRNPQRNPPARPSPLLPGSNRYECIDPHERQPRAARAVCRADRHDRLRLHRPRRPAAA